MGTDISIHGLKPKYTGPGDWAKQVKLGKNLTKKLGVVGIGLTITGAAVQGQWQNHHTADVAIGLVTTFLIASNPFTATVVGGYFLLDLGVQQVLQSIYLTLLQQLTVVIKDLCMILYIYTFIIFLFGKKIMIQEIQLFME